MTEEGRSNPFCFFCNFQREQSPQRSTIPISRLSSNKNNKTSLKRIITTPSVVNKRLATQPSVLSFTNRTSLPVHTESNRPSQVSLQPLTPKPTIRFSWNVDLQQTKKKQMREEVVIEQENGENQLDKTKPIHKKLQHLSSLKNLTKTSLISIADASPKVPKVEESVIMVDYFNPTSEQLLKLEDHLQSQQK